VTSTWKATKAKRVLAALERNGWVITRTKGSHRALEKDGWTPYHFAFHDGDEIGPKMVASIAKRTGLEPEDL
jgi:predicted RNA binding protein YcfA (HicA-like mRNA interferase family)